MHEASKIEGWIAVESHLIVDKMVSAPAWNAHSGQLILRNLLSIFVAAPTLMQSTPRVLQVLQIRMLLALLDDGVRVNCTNAMVRQ